MSYDSALTRCEAKGGTICDWKQIVNNPDSSFQSCALGGHKRYQNSFLWTNQSCSTQVKGKSQMNVYNPFLRHEMNYFTNENHRVYKKLKVQDWSALYTTPTSISILN